ncbi:regulatory protein RecX [Acidicapsa dinghuensis]|uniref:Regulatory protein RecX n=1 Tax=Acidicapsa dinghuensis TaxID=2218256 RepID=A0ABW1EHC4_9BACT|nr:regulatory protein RecX [Acidicapsa dinghuensis]
MPFGRTSKRTDPLDEPTLHEYALKSLGRKMRSEAELRRLMQSKVEPGETGSAKITRVLAKLKEYGLLNDTAFAETYARLRQENEKFGPRRVRQDLAQKGVAKPIIEETIEARYEAVDEETLARQYLDRKRLRKPENEKETARILRRMVGAGFSTSIIYKVLRQWNLPEESLSAIEGLDVEASGE